MRINPTLLPAALLIVAAGCKSGGSGAGPTDAAPVTKLEIKDTVVGTGPAVEKGDDVWVRYKGMFANGAVFDQNQTSDKDVFHVPVGAGQVIKGWDEGLVGMKKGGKRTIKVPWALAYGAAGKEGAIPPKADLTFDIEVKDLLKKEDANLIHADDVPGKTGSGPAAKTGDRVTVDYNALVNGASVEDRKNVSFTIGADDMSISGFDGSVVGMKVGGERKVIVPPNLTPKGRNDDFGTGFVTYDIRLTHIN